MPDITTLNDLVISKIPVVSFVYTKYQLRSWIQRITKTVFEPELGTVFDFKPYLQTPKYTPLMDPTRTALFTYSDLRVAGDIQFRSRWQLHVVTADRHPDDLELYEVDLGCVVLEDPALLLYVHKVKPGELRCLGAKYRPKQSADKTADVSSSTRTFYTADADAPLYLAKGPFSLEGVSRDPSLNKGSIQRLHITKINQEKE